MPGDARLNFGARVYFGTIVTSIFIQGCSLLQGIIIARLLGPAGRGQFAAILLWPNVFAAIGLLGVYMALARRAGRKEETGPLVKSAIIISCCTGGAAAALCYTALPYLLPEKMSEFLSVAVLFVAFIPLNHLSYNLLSIDQGAGNFRQYNFSRAILYPVFFCGLILVYFFASDRLKWIVVSLLLGNGIVVVSQLILKWKGLWSRGGVLPLQRLFREGWSFHILALFALISQYADQVLILWLLDSVDLGLYMIALSSCSVIATLPASLGIISFSEAARMDGANGFFSFAMLIRRSIVVLCVLGCLFAPVLPFLLPLIYGKDFVQAVPLASILLVGVLLSGLGTIVEQTLCGHGKPVAAAKARLLGTLILIGAGTLSVEKFAAQGIAFSYVLSQLIVLTVLLKIAVGFFENAHLRDFIPQRKDFFNSAGQ